MARKEFDMKSESKEIMMKAKKDMDLDLILKQLILSSICFRKREGTSNL